MALTYISYSSNETYGTSFTVGMPTGRASGDLLVLFFKGEVLATPSGWTLLGNTTLPAYQSYQDKVAVYYKFSDGTDSSVTFTRASSYLMLAAVLCFRGAGIPSGAFSTTRLGKNPMHIPSITTTIDGSNVVSVGVSRRADAYTSPADYWNAPSLLSITEIADFSAYTSGGALASGMAIALGVDSIAGTVSDTIVYPAGEYSRSGLAIAIPPSASGGARLNISGTWKNAQAKIKISGVWKDAQPYVKVGGIWKPTI